MINGNAVQSGLAEQSVDFAFVTGVPHVVGGLFALIQELRRVLKRDGSLAFRPSRSGTEPLIKVLSGLEMSHADTRRGFLIFKPKP